MFSWLDWTGSNGNGDVKGTVEGECKGGFGKGMAGGWRGSIARKSLSPPTRSPYHTQYLPRNSGRCRIEQHLLAHGQPYFQNWQGGQKLKMYVNARAAKKTIMKMRGSNSANLDWI